MKHRIRPWWSNCCSIQYIPTEFLCGLKKCPVVDTSLGIDIHDRDWFFAHEQAWAIRKGLA